MNHTANDRTPYTYLIIHKHTGRFYYGSRYGIGCHPSDFWVSYFTSSNDIKEMISEDSADSFHIEIRKVFDSVDRCRYWEARVIDKMLSHPLCINRTSAPGIAPMFGEKNPMFGKSRPDAVERMTSSNPMRNNTTAKKVSDTRKQKFASGELIPHAPKGEEAEAISKRMKENNPMKDKSISAKMHASMKEKYGGHPTAGSIWLANKITKTRKRISSVELDKYLESDGWIKLSNRKPIPD
jgi:hypothetical protein